MVTRIGKLSVAGGIMLLSVLNVVILKGQVPPSDPRFGEQWNLSMPGTPSQRADIRAVEAWGVTTGTPSMKIGIVEQDGSPSSFHPDLEGRLITGGIILSEHATNVAGIIAANANNGEGIAGLNWQSTLQAFEYSDTPGLAQAVTDATNAGCKVINMSIGYPDFSANLGKNCAMAYKSNRVLVAATGNEGSSIIRYPAWYGSTIAVGASNRDNTRSSFSSYWNYINFLAPGGDADPAPSERKILTTSLGGDGYDYVWGTSFSVPHVTGSASLLLARRSDLYNDDVSRLLEISCDKTSDMPPGEEFTEQHGYGRINLEKALQYLNAPYQLTHYSVGGGGTIFQTLNGFVVDMFGTSCGDARFTGKRHEVRRTVTFPAMSAERWVWGTGAASNGYGPSRGGRLFANETFCEVVPGTVTATSAVLRAYVWEVAVQGSGECYGWYPTSPQNLTFAYTVLGVPQPPLSVAITGPTTAPCATGTWTANAQGGAPPYSYQWYHMWDCGGGMEATQSSDPVPNAPCDSWSPIGTNSATLQYYLCGGNSILRVDVTDSQSGFASDQHYVAGAGGEGFARDNGNPVEGISLRPDKFNIAQNYPNPFNPETEISFALPEPSSVRITVMDVLGREIVTLADREYPAGYQRTTWRGTDDSGSKVGSGVYLYRIMATGKSGKQFMKVMKMALTK